MTAATPLPSITIARTTAPLVALLDLIGQALLSRLPHRLALAFPVILVPVTPQASQQELFRHSL
jgi:hypothetical protein